MSWYSSYTHTTHLVHMTSDVKQVCLFQVCSCSCITAKLGAQYAVEANSIRLSVRNVASVFGLGA